MMPLILAVAAAALIGTALASVDLRASRLAAALLLAGVGGGLWWSGTQGGTAPITVEARSSAGVPVTSQVLVAAPGGRRNAIAVPFARPIPASTPLYLMIGLGLLGAAASRRDRIALICTAGAAGAAGWAAAIYRSAGGRVEGEAAARAQLQIALPDSTIQQFTVPEPWQFETDAALIATGAAAVAALVWLGVGGRLKPAAQGLARQGVAIGAVLAAAACLWQISVVGGLPWRTAEGALAAVALMSGAAWALRMTPVVAGAVAGLTLAAALIGMT